MTELTKQIEFFDGRSTTIDKEDFGRLAIYKWYGSVSGYAVRNRSRNESLKVGKKGMVYLHKVIVPTSRGLYVDHIDGDKLNNTRANLRICTHAQNLANRRKPRILTSSIYKGVCWDKQMRLWRARITFNYRGIFLGLFKNETDAALEYNDAAKKFFGAFAQVNVIHYE